MKLDRGLLAKAAGVQSIGNEAYERLERFARAVEEANSKINLVSRASDIASETERQITLSVAAARFIDCEAVMSCVDIGSGAGFPAIPLAILRPDLTLTLVEPVSKRAFFLERTIQALGLTRTNVVNSRVESLIRTSEKRFDMITVKAVTDLKRVFGWADKLLLKGGSLITFKPSALGDSLKDGVAHRFQLDYAFSVSEILPEVDLEVLLYKKL